MMLLDTTDKKRDKGEDDMTFQERAFSFFKRPPLTEKPRRVGLLILSDRATPLAFQRAYLEDHSELIDKIKFVDHAGLVSRHSEEWLKRKIGLYQEYNIEVIIGGISFEIAMLQDKTSEYFKKAKQLGFAGLEISDDVIPAITQAERIAFIKEVHQLGLEPFTEVGRKFPDKPLDVNEVVTTTQSDLEAGASKVTIEGAEVAHCMKEGVDKLLQIVEQIGLENLIFEVGQPQLDVPVLAWVLNTLGPEVNLENVALEDCVVVTGMRLGIDWRIGYKFLTEKQGI
jgi:phosphosulfolactate synthase